MFRHKYRNLTLKFKTVHKLTKKKKEHFKAWQRKIKHLFTSCPNLQQLFNIKNAFTITLGTSRHFHIAKQTNT